MDAGQRWDEQSPPRKTLHEIWVTAYTAGYQDGRQERDYDPGLSMPDDIDMYREV